MDLELIREHLDSMKPKREICFIDDRGKMIGIYSRILIEEGITPDGILVSSELAEAIRRHFALKPRDEVSGLDFPLVAMSGVRVIEVSDEILDSLYVLVMKNIALWSDNSEEIGSDEIE